jgi:hypothetical protein
MASAVRLFLCGVVAVVPPHRHRRFGCCVSNHASTYGPDDICPVRYSRGGYALLSVGNGQHSAAERTRIAIEKIPLGCAAARDPAPVALMIAPDLWWMYAGPAPAGLAVGAGWSSEPRTIMATTG